MLKCFKSFVNFCTNPERNPKKCRAAAFFLYKLCFFLRFLCFTFHLWWLLTRLVFRLVQIHLMKPNHLKRKWQSHWRLKSCVAQLQGFICQADTEKLVHVFITCRLDYCTALPKSSSNTGFNKSEENRADYTQVWKSLHWLLISSTISSKVFYWVLNLLMTQYWCVYLISLFLMSSAALRPQENNRNTEAGTVLAEH